MSERITNDEIVKQLKEVAAVMQINGENRFGIRAYQNAISSIESLTTSVYDLWEDTRLRDIEGVGSSLNQHLTELLENGEVKEWEKKKEKFPKGMFELLQIRGVGPKTAYKLAKKFKLDSREDALEKVKEVAKRGQIRELSGFGEKSEQDILDSIVDLKKSKNEKERTLLFNAEKIADRIIRHLSELDSVEEAIALGSLRRRVSTVGDLDLAVSSTKPEEIIEHFVKFPEIKEIETQGEKMSTVILGIGMQVDILVIEPESFGSMLQHFTGSKQHNIKLRQYALDKGMSLSQYGIKESDELKKFAKEEDFYRHLGLQWIPPELREGRDEIEYADKDNLPELIKLSDIKGDLHMHTIASDGVNTLEEMVEKARKLGYEYIGIADHAPSVISRGRYEVLGIIDSTRRKIDELNEKYDDIKILYGYEVNILKDKSLGMTDDLLEKLDYAIGGIHTSFDVDRELATQRLIGAIENPYIDIIAHPAGRMINERDSMDIDWSEVFKAVKENSKILEINAQPKRLDLPSHLVYDARKEGIKLIINTDAHSIEELDHIRYGVDAARRGWCKREDIINTLIFEKIQESFRFDL